jgi:hypothetical protein
MSDSICHSKQISDARARVLARANAVNYFEIDNHVVEGANNQRINIGMPEIPQKWRRNIPFAVVNENVPAFKRHFPSNPAYNNHIILYDIPLSVPHFPSNPAYPNSTYHNHFRQHQYTDTRIFKDMHFFKSIFD